MDIIVEIGEDTDKKFIEQELKSLANLVREIKPSIKLYKFIVPNDFEETINLLEGTKSYKATRGLDTNNIKVLGRLVKIDDGYGIVLSPSLYLKGFDEQVRVFFIFHEIIHVLNKEKFPSFKEAKLAEDVYNANLYTLYDEYFADRTAYNIVNKYFEVQSVDWKNFLSNLVNGHIENVCDIRYHAFFQSEINLFRSHASVDTYLENTKSHFGDLAVSISHIFALIHQYPEISYNDLQKSKFINQKTFKLFEFLNLKYSQKETNLDDGLKVISDFMENFGVRLENRDGVIYYYILDI